MLNPNHSLTTCGGPEAVLSSSFLTICGVKTISGKQEPYQESPEPTYSASLLNSFENITKV